MKSSLPFLDPVDDIILVQEITFELADIAEELPDMKQKKFKRTAKCTYKHRTE